MVGAQRALVDLARGADMPFSRLAVAAVLEQEREDVVCLPRPDMRAASRLAPLSHNTAIYKFSYDE